MTRDEAAVKAAQAYHLLMEIHTARYGIVEGVPADRDKWLLARFAALDAVIAARRILNLLNYTPIPDELPNTDWIDSK